METSITERGELLFPPFQLYAHKLFPVLLALFEQGTVPNYFDLFLSADPSRSFLSSLARDRMTSFSLTSALRAFGLSVHP